MLLGLDGSGKSSLLLEFAGRYNEPTSHMPSIGYYMETLDHRGFTINAFGLGGRGFHRAIWRHFTQNIEGVVVLVDASDTDRWPVGAKYSPAADGSSGLGCDLLDELWRAIDPNEFKNNTPYLFVANKQDAPNARSSSDLAALFSPLLARHGVSPAQWRAIEHGKGEGIKKIMEGMEWMKKYKTNPQQIETTNTSVDKATDDKPKPKESAEKRAIAAHDKDKTTAAKASPGTKKEKSTEEFCSIQ